MGGLMVSYHSRIELFQNHPSKRNPGKREGVWHVVSNDVPRVGGTTGFQSPLDSLDLSIVQLSEKHWSNPRLPNKS